jgi:hypothetical protein
LLGSRQRFGEVTQTLIISSYRFKDRPCLDKKNWQKTSYQIFGHMHGVLNVDKIKKQLHGSPKLRDESFEPNCAMI